MSAIEALEVNAGYGDSIVVPELSLSIPKGQIVSIIGANGSGKSTILKALARLLAPKGGTVLLEGRDIQNMDSKQVARKLSLLPQTHDAPDGLCVRDFVSYGRFPHMPAFGGLTKQDIAAVDKAIRLTQLGRLEERPLATLSGGERQRAWIALNLAQEPETMLLDEPTTFLDIRHQHETMELICRMNRTLRLTIVMVLHDLNHASRCSHRIVAVKDGRIYRQGPPREIVTEELIREIFGVESRIVMDDGYPFFIPVGASLEDGAKDLEMPSTHMVERKALVEYGQA